MGKSRAWDIINKVVAPRIKEIGLDERMKLPYGTIMSEKDWDNGVAMYTPVGTVHVLGTGEIIDEENVLKYR